MSPATARGFWPMRDLPVVGWLLLTLAAVVAGRTLPEPRWLLIHLLLLGAATHSILVWSRYFTDALLHTDFDPADRARQNRRLVLLNVGVVLVVAGVPGEVWWLTLLGGTAIAVAAAWHGASLYARLRDHVSARFAVTIRYYLVAAAMLPVGAALGITLARVESGPWHVRLMAAHASVNLLGWLGITALGTLLTLWPTMLRTRIPARAEQSARRALPVLLLGLVLAVGGPLVGCPVLAGLGWLTWLAGAALTSPALVAAARVQPPRSFATLSVAAAWFWLAAGLLALAAVVLTGGRWAALDERLDVVTPLIAAGFGAQLLLGAMSYLIPVALGGGPAAVGAATTALDQFPVARVLVTNLALVACLPAFPPEVRMAGGLVSAVVLAAFLPLMVSAMGTSRRVRMG